MQSLGCACKAGCHWCWGCHRWRRSRGRHRGNRCWCGPCLHREVAGSQHVGSIHQVANFSSVVRSGQRRARCMCVRLHGFRMVQGISCSIQWGSIWEVANRVGKIGPWQWRSRSVWIWSNRLWMVDAIAGPVQWCAIWQVALVSHHDISLESTKTPKEQMKLSNGQSGKTKGKLATGLNPSKNRQLTEFFKLLYSQSLQDIVIHCACILGS